MNNAGMYNNRRILLIDDNQDIHNDFRKILGGQRYATAYLDDAEAVLFGNESTPTSESSFELDSAFQGQVGLEMVRRASQAGRPYAMAFVDVRMPHGWDSIETVAHLWQEDPRLQVVICTAYSDYSWDKMTEKLGVTDRLLILKKPFDNVEVKQLACALTEKWNLAQQTIRTVYGLEEAVHEQTRELQDQKQDLENMVEQLNQTHAQLLQAQKLESIGQLAAGIAHEINTPTQFVGDNTHFLKDSFSDVQVLLEKYQRLLEANQTGSVTKELVAEVEAAAKDADVKYLTDEIPKAIEQTLEGIERITKIVRSMKDFSHPGSEEKQPIDLNKCVETTITVARNEWKYVSDMVDDLDPSLPLVPCHAGDINQVLLNMIVNAAQAIMEVVGDGSSEKGTITVSTRRNGEWVEVHISDTGCGISEDVRSKVFDPFFTTKEVGKGTGQGLAISHDVIVNKHSGSIDIESELGKGTTFTIRLPIVPKEYKQEIGATSNEAAHTVCR